VDTYARGATGPLSESTRCAVCQQPLSASEILNREWVEPTAIEIEDTGFKGINALEMAIRHVDVRKCVAYIRETTATAAVDLRFRLMEQARKEIEYHVKLALAGARVSDRLSASKPKRSWLSFWNQVQP